MLCFSCALQRRPALCIAALLTPRATVAELRTACDAQRGAQHAACVGGHGACLRVRNGGTEVSPAPMMIGVAAHRHLGTIGSVRHARLQLHNEWTLSMRIADMAQKARKPLQ